MSKILVTTEWMDEESAMFVHFQKGRPGHFLPFHHGFPQFFFKQEVVQQDSWFFKASEICFV